MNRQAAEQLEPELASLCRHFAAFLPAVNSRRAAQHSFPVVISLCRASLNPQDSFQEVSAPSPISPSPFLGFTWRTVIFRERFNPEREIHLERAPRPNCMGNQPRVPVTHASRWRSSNAHGRPSSSALHAAFRCVTAPTGSMIHLPGKLDVATHPTNLQQAFDRLAGVIREHLKRDPRMDAAFLFHNEKRTHIKLISRSNGGLPFLPAVGCAHLSRDHRPRSGEGTHRDRRRPASRMERRHPQGATRRSLH